MNIYDIAQKAGVSASTVSRVINNNPNVSRKSREKVREVMEREGYTPNIFARGLNLNSIKTVGILCPVIDDLNHVRAVAILERLLRRQGFDSLLCSAESNEADKSKCFTLFLNKRVDAILVIGSTMAELEDSAAYRAAAEHVPVLVINGLVRCPNVYCVLCDEEAAVTDLVQKLCARGHREIVYITDSPTYSAYQKLSGYRKGLAACGLAEDPERILQIAPSGQEGASAYRQMLSLTESGPSFSAVLASDDMVAIGALKATRERGLEVPVVGFNNSDFAFCSTPSLSSVDNNMEALCKAAVDTLMNILGGETAIARIVVSARFVERDSFRL